MAALEYQNALGRYWRIKSVRWNRAYAEGCQGAARLSSWLSRIPAPAHLSISNRIYAALLRFDKAHPLEAPESQLAE